MPTKTSRRILVAPLDWGLGHTTRCVPVIRCLLGLGHEVIVAGNEHQRLYIENTIAGIETIYLEGYNVKYGKEGSNFLLSIFSQAPRILKSIRREHLWLAQKAKTLNIDGVVSDNRYGMHHPGLPCVIMTHQLQVQTGMGSIADSIVQRQHYKALNKFRDKWIADVANQNGLAGKLSHPARLPPGAAYIGLLSQMNTLLPQQQDDDGHLLILLSGPEPQRTILSGKLWAQLPGYKGRVVFVEGSGDALQPGQLPPNITWHKRITSDTLQPLLQKAKLVICSSGYSTMMDLVRLRKKAIIIPTPGQTEQEYLGRYLHAAGIFYNMPQKGFNLNQAIEQLSAFPFKNEFSEQSFSVFENAIGQWISKLK